MALSEEERQAAAEEFRRQLQEEHDQRLEQLDRRKARARAKRQVRDERGQQSDLNEVREAVRERFYKDNGYKEYTDSTGRQHWLTAEEFEFRMRRRKNHRRRNRIYEPERKTRSSTVMMYLVLLGTAVAVGLILAR